MNDPPIEVSSPACAMHEADAAYFGFADRAELIGLLNALLRAAPPEPAGWGPVLRRHLAALGATPVAESVAASPADRRRVVSELRAMLPRIRDDGLYRDLREMLRGCANEAASPPPLNARAGSGSETS
jgi:hypothetical protein